MSALSDLRVCSLRGLRVLYCEVQGARFESPLLRAATDLLRAASPLLRVARFENVLLGGVSASAGRWRGLKVPTRWRGFQVLQSSWEVARFQSAAKCCELASWRVRERAALIDWKSIFSGKESQRILQLYSFWGFEV